MTTKEEIIFMSCDLMGIERFHVSSGSTEPREFILAVAYQLGVIRSLNSPLTKIQTARQTVEAFGYLWEPSFESAGGTVTKLGLEALHKVVVLAVGNRSS